MNYLPLILQIQKEQLKNPLRRYKEVREFYAKATKVACIFYNFFSFSSFNCEPRHEPFPKSLFSKISLSHYSIFEIPYHTKIAPVTLELAIKVCGKYSANEKNIVKGFEWDHCYAVCPEIITPLTNIEQLAEAECGKWIQVTPKWVIGTLEEFNDPDNL